MISTSLLQKFSKQRITENEAFRHEFVWEQNMKDLLDNEMLIFSCNIKRELNLFSAQFYRVCLTKHGHTSPPMNQ